MSDLDGVFLFRISDSEHARRDIDDAAEDRIGRPTVADPDFDLHLCWGDDVIGFESDEVNVLRMKHLHGQASCGLRHQVVRQGGYV